MAESCDVILSRKHREENGLNEIVHGRGGVIEVEEEDAALLCLFCAGAYVTWEEHFLCYSSVLHFSLIWVFVIEMHLGQ
jgi:hypothetical protein